MILDFMDLRQPRVNRCSNVGVVHGWVMDDRLAW